MASMGNDTRPKKASQSIKGKKKEKYREIKMPPAPYHHATTFAENFYGRFEGNLKIPQESKLKILGG